MALSVPAMGAVIALRCVELSLDELFAHWLGPRAEVQAVGCQCQDEHSSLPAVDIRDDGLNQPVR